MINLLVNQKYRSKQLTKILDFVLYRFAYKIDKSRKQLYL